MKKMKLYLPYPHAQSVEIIREHPLLPSYVLVHGLVIDPHTGKVDVIHIDKKKEEV